MDFVVQRGKTPLQKKTIDNELRQFTHRSTTKRNVESVKAERCRYPGTPVTPIRSSARSGLSTIGGDRGSILQTPAHPPQTEKYASREPRTTAKVKKRGSGTSIKPRLFYGMAVILFGLGILVAITGLKANDKVAAQVEMLQRTATKQPGGAAPAGTLPSTDKPSGDSFHQHQVASDLPRYIMIPKLGVSSRVYTMGLNDKNELDTPNNIYDTGWFSGSSKPGTPGAMLVDGHSGIGKTNGVFHNAAKLKKGDLVVVTRGDGEKFNYQVSEVKVLKVNQVDMTSMITPADGAPEGINIITCTGKLIPGTTSLDQRVLVRAVRG